MHRSSKIDSKRKAVPHEELGKQKLGGVCAWGHLRIHTVTITTQTGFLTLLISSITSGTLIAAAQSSSRFGLIPDNIIQAGSYRGQDD